MTIVEAIQVVLADSPQGMTSKEVYNQIIQKGLYSFGAKNPQAVVNGEIRRRCIGIDFPTAYPVKIFRITGSRGRKNLFALYNEEHHDINNSNVERTYDSSEELPEERIGAALEEHNSAIKQQVLDCVLKNSFNFFEHLVLRLLLSMGYGYDEKSGIVTGKPHDGGIDGIISEDKLGLDLIYLQAKRYSPPKNVSRNEIQAFIGAMEHIQKGVFITTSCFTKQAKVFVDKQQQKSIKLIDGELLSDLLVKFEVGVITDQKITLYKIDTDFFGE